MNAVQAYKIATLNLNKIRSSWRLQHLQDFLYAADVDIILLQEVTNIKLEMICGYNAITNPGIGAELGTAILLKEGIHATQIEKLTSSRGIAATVNNARIINVYAPSGNNNRRARAEFFKSEIVPLFGNRQDHIILAGDFNCVLSAKDQTPNFNKSIELEQIVHQLQLTDTWEQTHGVEPGFTYFTSHSASRLDRIYVSSNIKNHILQSEVWPTIISDHAAYITTINMKKQETYRARGIWKLNITHLQDEECQVAFTDTWKECEKRFPRYNSAIAWWLQCAKPKIRKMLIEYSRQKSFWMRKTTEFYFGCLRDLYTPNEKVIENYTQIQKIKAKLLVLKRQQSEGYKIRARIQNTLQEEETSMYHMMRENKRGNRKILTEVKLPDGTSLTKQNEIKDAVHKYITEILSRKPTDENALKELIRNISRKINTVEAENLTVVIEEDELKEAILQSPKNKSPGPDGIPVEFYQVFWPQMKSKMLCIFNEIMNGKVDIPKEFPEGVMVLIPKKPVSKGIENLRPITLLNSDYKIMARVLAKRMKMVMNSITGPYQTCVGKDRNIQQNISEYRDVISTAEVCQIKCALVSLDFEKAFDRVDHRYLLKIMEVMGFPPRTLQIIQQILNNSRTRIMINGQLTKEIEMTTSVRQGCPMSMILFAIAIEPLLLALTQQLQGLHINGNKIVCNAYADDVGFIVTNEDEITKALNIVHIFELASGAKLNKMKSGIMNIGSGICMENQGQLPKVPKLKCLGIDFRSNIQHTIAVNYKNVLTNIRASVQANSLRKLNELQKATLVNVYIISKLNYVAQALPVPLETAKRLMSAIGNFVSKSNIFKVKFDTLTLPTNKGGLGLIDVNYKARALYVCRMYKQWKQSPNSLTAHLLNEITPDSLEPPVDVKHIPTALYHLKNFLIEYSYISSKVTGQQIPKVKDIYAYLMETKKGNVIETKYPNHDWPAIWRNISDRNIPSQVKATWYNAVNRKIPTNSKLHAIHLLDSPLCKTCNLIDTEEHRFVCEDAKDVWNVIKQKLATITRTSANYITPEDFLNPEKIPYPNTKRNSVNWLKGHSVHYLMTNAKKSKEEFWLYITSQLHILKKTKHYRENYAKFLEVTLR